MAFEEGKSGNPDKQFKPGETGNPNGRPRGRGLKAIFDELLDMEAKGVVLQTPEVIQLMAELQRKVTYREAFAIRTMAKALSNPESKSAERLADRTEGKPPQSLDITTDGDKISTVNNIIIENPNPGGKDQADKTSV